MDNEQVIQNQARAYVEACFALSNDEARQVEATMRSQGHRLTYATWGIEHRQPIGGAPQQIINEQATELANALVRYQQRAELCGKLVVAACAPLSDSPSALPGVGIWVTGEREDTSVY